MRLPVLSVLMSCLLLCSAPARADSLQSLREEVARIAATVDSDVGASIAFAGAPPIALINGDRPFPMMSTVKTLVALQALDRVADGDMRLDTQITVTADDLSILSPINLTFPDAPITTSLQNLIWTAIVDSDNSAPNAMMRRMDGPAGVEAFVRDLGVSGINVDSNINGLFMNAYQVDTFAEVRDLVAEKSAEAGGSTAFFLAALDSPIWTDTRDTVTPDAMVEVLSKFAAGEVIAPAQTQLLMSIMEQTRTGPDRLNGMLPPGTVVGHKTGTGHNAVNDTGYIRLPDGRILAIAVYTNSPAAYGLKENVIAQIARAAYDWAVFSQ